MDAKDTREIALYKSSTSLKTAYALYDSMAKVFLDKETKDELIAHFNRICLCASVANHFIAKDLHSEETGELYDGYGRFWRCNSKLCEYCLSINAKRNRRKLFSRIINAENKYTYRYYFITFTFPHNHFPLLKSREIINRAWQLLRKRSYFRENILAGVKTEEFTFGKFGYNYHLHTLFHSKFLSFQKIREEWTLCLEIAFNEQKEALTIKTKDRLAMIKIVTISANEKSLKKICFELCKYITKSDSWSKVPPKDLISVALIRRFNRMFELIGNWRNQTILDKTRISDDETIETKSEKVSQKTYWRDFARNAGADKCHEATLEEFQKTRFARFIALKIKFPFAEFRDLDFRIIEIE